MKKIMFLLVGILALTFLGYSQSPSGSKCPMMQKGGGQCHSMMQKPSGGHQGMMKQIDLSDAQKAQMKTIREEKKLKMQELEKNDNITLGDYKARKESLSKEYKVKMEGVLTAEQKTKIKVIREEKMADNKKMMDSRLQQLKSDLSLSDDQYSKLKIQHDQMFTKVKAIRENESLSPAQKKEQIKALHEGNKGKMKEVLNPEQMKKFQESMKESREDHLGMKGRKMRMPAN